MLDPFGNLISSKSSLRNLYQTTYQERLERITISI
jgi:hypothetical protein